MNIKENNLKEIPIFFSTDNNYLPFLAVAIRSLIDNASSDFSYRINILNMGLYAGLTEKFTKMQSDRVTISFIDISERFKLLSGNLSLRDYYSPSIYYRLFIQSMFPEYDKAIYLDCDIVVTGDISKFYTMDLGENLLGVISDQVVENSEVFREYVQKVVGVRFDKYFNSGVLLMNLDKLRENRIEERFIELINTYGFDTIAPDQDYLNYLCRDRVLYIDKSWNKMTTPEEYKGKPNLIHYNMYKKPWLYSKVKYGSHFWKYAKGTEFYDQILEIKSRFTQKDRQNNILAGKRLGQQALDIINSDTVFTKLK